MIRHSRYRGFPPIPELRPSRVPLVIVCGPPAAGKSTYVRAEAAAGDVVIDLDEIQAKLTGRSLYESGSEVPYAALAERNRRLQALTEAECSDERVWFVVGAASCSERRRWRLLAPERVVLLLTPAEECKRRLAADPRRRQRLGELFEAVDDWWRRYEPDPRDVVATRGP